MRILNKIYYIIENGDWIPFARMDEFPVFVYHCMPIKMKQMIASAFEEMAQYKPIDKITVKNLVEECRISRQTFYYHFQDILEVMEWSVKHMMQQALENSRKAESHEKALEAFIRTSIEQQDLLVKLLLSQHHTQVEYIFVDAMRSSIQQMLYDRIPNLSLNHQDMDIALNFYTYGIAGAIFDNCKYHTMDTEALACKLCLLISGRFIS